MVWLLEIMSRKGIVMILHTVCSFMVCPFLLCFCFFLVLFCKYKILGYIFALYEVHNVTEGTSVRSCNTEGTFCMYDPFSVSKYFYFASAIGSIQAFFE